MRARGWATAVVAMLVAGAADAAPPATAPGKVPMTLVPCVPRGDGPRLLSSNGDPVVCWGGGCMKLVDRDPAVLVAAPAERAASTAAGPEVVERDGSAQVCLAAECTPLGPKLAARVARERKRKDAAGVDATTDRKVVVIGDEIWNVATDKRVRPRTPARYSGHEDPPTVAGVDVAGNLLVVSWSNCAGPCTVSQLVDDAGKNRGAAVDGGFVLALDGQRFVIVSEYAALRVFDAAGKPLGRLEGGSDPNAAQVIALDESTIGILRTDGDDAYRLVVVAAAVDVPLRVQSERFLPVCQP
jgi:hypothetical protein